MVSQRGFTIVELLVTMVIVSIVIGLTYASFNTVMKDVKSETKSMEAIMDVLTGLEIMRLDLAHMGFGLAEQGHNDNNNRKEEPCAYPVRTIKTDNNNPPNCTPTVGADDIVNVHANKSQALIIRSTVNTTNELTYGWTTYVCGEDNITGINLFSQTGQSYNPIQGNDDVVIMTQGFKFLSRTKFNNVNGFCNEQDRILLAFPVDISVSNGCERQYCNRINYRLRGTNNLAACHPKTFPLERVVGGGTGMPIINCVANFQVRFRRDTNNDGKIDDHQEIYNFSNKDGTLNRVDVYLLIQDSTYDPDFNNNMTATDLTVREDFNGDGDTNDTGETLNLATTTPACQGTDITTNPTCFANFTNYRWRIIKLSAQPKNGVDVFGLWDVAQN